MPTEQSPGRGAEGHSHIPGRVSSPFLLELQMREGNSDKGLFIESLQNSKEFGLWGRNWETVLGHS